MRRIKSIKLNSFIVISVFLAVFAGIGGFAILANLKNSIIQMNLDKLEMVTEIKKNDLERYMQHRINDLNVLAKNTEVINLAIQLKDIHESQHLHGESYLDNKEIQRLFRQNDPFFKEFVSAFDFYDFFIIDAESSHILYSVLKESDLSTNLQTGMISHTKLAEAYRTALEMNQPYVSDMESYASSGGIPSFFAAVPLKDKDGKTIAVAAVQFTTQQLEKILTASTVDNSRTKEIYLIGHDGLVRSNTLQKGSLPGLADILKNPGKWNIHSDIQKIIRDGSQRGIIEGKDYHGDDVYAMHDTVQFGNIQWHLVTKIDKSEVMSIYEKDARHIVFILVLTVLGILSLAFGLIYYASKQILNNVLSISANAKKVSEGNFQIDYIPELYNELMPMEQTIQNQINVLGSLSRAVNRIKENIEHMRFDSRIDTSSFEGEYALMVETMNQLLERVENHIWLSSGTAQIVNELGQIDDIEEMSKKAIDFICTYLGAPTGAVYLVKENQNVLELSAAHAFTPMEQFGEKFTFGHGNVGETAIEKRRLVINVQPSSDTRFKTGTATLELQSIICEPIMEKDNLIGIIEIALFKPLSEIGKEFLAEAVASFGMLLYTIMQAQVTKELLLQSQEQKAELQTQSEELQQTNVVLEEQQQNLEAMTQDLQLRNDQLQNTKDDLLFKTTELERTNRYKSEFLANMSHELRTPLNSIILLSKLLGDEGQAAMDEETLKKIRIIHKSGNDLLRLINDVLDLSKVEAGKMELIPSTFSIASIVDELHDGFDYLAREKSLTFAIANHFTEEITTDYEKLLQVIKNLLSNAFKFTEKGSITIEIDKNSLQNSLEISVIDTGAGIAKENHLSIFDPFRQEDGSTSRKYGGTGLGLAICKKFVTMMGGEIYLEHSSKEGSHFKVVLPLRETPPTIPQKPDTVVNREDPVVIFGSDSQNDANPVRLEGKSVLIVDDDVRNIYALSSLIESAGAKVFTAFDGREALETLQEEGVDVVLMDIMMPEMDGYETIRKIRQELLLSSLTIIVITAKAMKEDQENALKAGANDYLPKPVNFDMLLQMIKNWTEKR